MAYQKVPLIIGKNSS